MKINVRQSVLAAAVAAGLGLCAFAAQAAPAPFQDKDYSKYKTYQQGVREGHADQAKKMDHSRKHHFKKDEDQKAYEAGYQKGHGN